MVVSAAFIAFAEKAIAAFIASPEGQAILAAAEAEAKILEAEAELAVKAEVAALFSHAKAAIEAKLGIVEPAPAAPAAASPTQ